MRRRTEVYSWRLSPVLKAGLEDAARRGRRSVARLLEEIVTERLLSDAAISDVAAQRDLHRRAEKFVGSIAGNDANRATRARVLIRRRLRRKAE